MRLLQTKTHIDFIGNRWKYFAASLALMAVSFGALAVRGVVYGIDFTGGEVLNVSFAQPITLASLRSAMEESGVPDAAILSFADTKAFKNSFSIRVKGEGQSAQVMEEILEKIRKTVSPNSFTVDKKEYVGPSVGRYLYRRALWAIVLSLGGIVLYVAFRFATPIWGLAGVLALAHDVIATLGLFSLFGCEVDLLIVSALLTIAGLSINDTIVIFDRMREKMRVMRHEPLGIVINQSINETLSRTIITSGTFLIVVIVLYFLGGKVIHNFAMALVFGATVGTYSSIGIAAPLVYEWTLRMSPKRALEGHSGGERKPKRPGR